MVAGLARGLANALAASVAAATAIDVRIVGVDPASGTSFDQAVFLHLADGRRLFAKMGPEAVADRFAGEASGLAALAAPGILRVPRWAASGTDAESGRSFVIMEAIAQAGRGDGRAWALLGRQLAEHHRATRGRRFGFDRTTHCGATAQPNAWTADGVAFWRDQRLAHQLDLARSRGLADRELSKAGDRFLAGLDRILDPAARPCLLHGDLWSGNVLADAPGGPAVIDPAVSCGHREAELAMCHLFGGFPPAFFAAYREAWPLRAGAEDRRPAFTLYHLLNHLNLFGLGYRDACMRVLAQFR